VHVLSCEVLILVHRSLATQLSRNARRRLANGRFLSQRWDFCNVLSMSPTNKVVSLWYSFSVRCESCRRHCPEGLISENLWEGWCALQLKSNGLVVMADHYLASILVSDWAIAWSNICEPMCTWISAFICSGWNMSTFKDEGLTLMKRKDALSYSSSRIWIIPLHAV
jgi:hypothetical protein